MNLPRFSVLNFLLHVILRRGNQFLISGLHLGGFLTRLQTVGRLTRIAFQSNLYGALSLTLASAVPPRFGHCTVN